MTNPLVSLVVQRVNHWNQTHAPNQRIDLAAELAVGSMEGLSGRVGDGGHAFGPNQENDAGGVLTGRFPGWSVQQKQAWASSPPGVDDALARIARVAGGLRGQQAVSAIVSRFERPANPGREIAGANAAYGTVPVAPAALAPTLPPGGGTPVAPRGLSAGLLQAVNTGNQMFGLPALPTSLTAAPVAAPTLTAPPLKPAVIPGAPVAPTVLKTPGRLAMVPTRIATRAGIELNSQFLPTVNQIAAKFGVKVNSGYRSPVHNAAVGGAASSDHLSGSAVDFTGTQAQMKALYQWAQTQPFKYLEPWDQAGGNHVHVSF